MYRYLKSKGYDDSLLGQTGLVTIEERGTHDKFWNRVMFPILDVNNRVIGFGGRVMGEGEPKYLNSPETKVFDKSRNLYGLNFARASREKSILICEGYMDVIAMHQAGFTLSLIHIYPLCRDVDFRGLQPFGKQGTADGIVRLSGINVWNLSDSQEGGINAVDFNSSWRSGLRA